jgi:hypothetical protein
LQLPAATIALVFSTGYEPKPEGFGLRNFCEQQSSSTQEFVNNSPWLPAPVFPGRSTGRHEFVINNSPRIPERQK